VAAEPALISEQMGMPGSGGLITFTSGSAPKPKADPEIRECALSQCRFRGFGKVLRAPPPGCASLLPICVGW
jgi:hypothetical protein